MGKSRKRKSLKSTNDHNKSSDDQNHPITADEDDQPKQSEESSTKCPPKSLFGMTQHFLLVSVMVLSLSVITSVCVSYWWCHADNMDHISSYIPATNDVVESHQKVSLFEEYSVDYDELMKIRERNMKKYAYEYNTKGIDRRSGLSLQEYRDVYDGKW